MMEPKISIVVPVFNGAKTIEKTLKSILNQSLAAIEIIVVDDGSTDRTVDIVSAIVDSRIRIITQANAGVSSARNAGICAATGEYVGFVDADDRIKEDMYEKVYQGAPAVDVIASRLLLEKEGKFCSKESFLTFDKLYSQEEFKQQILVRYLTFENLDLLSVVNKIYKRRFLIEKGIWFDENLALEEDGMFNLKVYTQMESMVQMDYSGYYYLANESSVTRDFITSNSLDKLIKKFHWDYKKEFDLTFSAEEILTFKSARLIYSICFLLFSLSKAKMTSAEKKRFIAQIMDKDDVLYAAQHLPDFYLQSRSKFEKIMTWCILKNKKGMVQFLVGLLSLAHQTRLLKIIKKLN